MTDRQKEAIKVEEERKEKEKTRREELKRSEFLDKERQLQNALLDCQNQVCPSLIRLMQNIKAFKFPNYSCVLCMMREVCHNFLKKKIPTKEKKECHLDIWIALKRNHLFTSL